MIIDVLTLFPDFYQNPLKTSILSRAQKKGLVTINIHNLRNWAKDKYGTVDDRPYGGGPGMILKPEPIYNALQDLKKKAATPHIILLTPKGKIYNQKIAQKLTEKPRIILICGHYEGFDERIINYVHQKISIGKYILTGGEIPSLVLIDSLVRLIPGVLKKESLKNESFSQNLSTIEYPQYTRPKNFKGRKVPSVLLSGNHQKIEKWRQKMSKKLRNNN